MWVNVCECINVHESVCMGLCVGVCECVSVVCANVGECINVHECVST